MQLHLEPRRSVLITIVTVASVALSAWVLSSRSDALTDRSSPVRVTPATESDSQGGTPHPAQGIGDERRSKATTGRTAGAPPPPIPSAAHRATTSRVDFYRTLVDSDRLASAVNGLGARNDQLGARMTAFAMAGELCLLGASGATVGAGPAEVADAPGTPASSASRENERARAAQSALSMRRVAYKCAGVDLGDREHVDRLWQMAAATGDPVAQAYVSWRNAEASFAPDPALVASGFPHPEKVRAPERWTASAVESILRALATRDPAAIAVLGPLLQTTSHTDGLALADSGLVLAELPHSAWTLIACEYGLRCDGTSTAVLAACANEGRCDVSSMEELVRRHLWTPTEAEQFDRVRDTLRALVESGQPSLLRIVPLDNTKPIRRRYASIPLRFVPPG